MVKNTQANAEPKNACGMWWASRSPPTDNSKDGAIRLARGADGFGFPLAHVCRRSMHCCTLRVRMCRCLWCEPCAILVPVLLSACKPTITLLFATTANLRRITIHSAARPMNPVMANMKRCSPTPLFLSLAMNSPTQR